MITYLDNAATTPISPAVKRALAEGIEEYGNPSSLHSMGVRAHDLLERSRTKIASFFGCNEQHIYFTSGATESANIILQGYAAALKRSNSSRNEILISPIEHPAVENTCAFLGKSGFVVKKLPVDSSGIVPIETVLAELTPQTAIVAVMHTNNETGSRQEIETLAAACKKLDPGILFVSDIVQAAGKFPLDTLASSVDAFFLSGHKLGAPKGMGLFYLNPSFRIQPLIQGGGQEFGYRSGTTSPLNAHLLACALEDRIANMSRNTKHVTRLNEEFIDTLVKEGVAVERIVPLEHTSPYVLCCTFPATRGEYLLKELSKRDVCVSQGSACSSNSHAKSRILEALGVDYKRMDGALRVSFSPENTSEEVVSAAHTIRDIVSPK